MAEYRFFAGEVPFVSTAEFHAGRERVAHLEQLQHRPRLDVAAMMVAQAASASMRVPEVTVSDLGCGDGGLLSLLELFPHVAAWGYDFQPSNEAGWAERCVRAELADVFGADRDRVKLGDVTVVTEVLEHIADPHGAVRWIGEHSEWIVASSPWNEVPGRHDECHAWGWDPPGYRALICQGGFEPVRHESVGPFQVLLGRRP